MNTKLILPLLAVSLLALGGSNALAQTPSTLPDSSQQTAPSQAPTDETETQDPESSTDPTDESDVPGDDLDPEQETSSDDEVTEDAEDDFFDSSEENDEEDFDAFDSPISDLAGQNSEIEFIPLEEIEEGALEQIAALGL